MNEILIKIENEYKPMAVEDYLKLNIEYHWIDMIRLAIQYNISIKRLLVKLINHGALAEIDSANIAIVAKYIDRRLWELRYPR